MKQISDERKTVHDDFKYLSKSPAAERVWAGAVTPHPSAPPYFPADSWIFHLTTTLPLFSSWVNFNKKQ
jgi:hypothetical protein